MTVFWPTGINGLPVPQLPETAEPDWHCRFFATFVVIDAHELCRLERFLDDARSGGLELALPATGGAWWLVQPVGPLETTQVSGSWYRSRFEMVRLD